MTEFDMPDEEAITAYIDFLVENGGMVLDGISEEGEPLYTHNMEILEEIAPEYAAVVMRELEDSLIHLYEEGLVDIEISDEGEVFYSVSDKAGGKEQS